MSEIEGLEGDLVVQERAELLRSKIKVASCNINDDPPVKETDRMFSISYTLEVASKTIDDLKSGVKKLVKLLRLGG